MSDAKSNALQVTDASKESQKAVTATGSQLHGDVKKLMQYDADKKSSIVAYFLWFFLGLFGIHRFYLGRSGTGIALLLLAVARLGLDSHWHRPRHIGCAGCLGTGRCLPYPRHSSRIQ
jgi:hypothetical protein